MAIKLGELLVQNQIITEGQLAEALRSQQMFGGRLGTNLVELGYLSEQALTKFLSAQLKIPAIGTAQLDSVSEEALKLLPRATAERFKVVPVAVSGRKLQIAMADPTDLKAIDDVSFSTGCAVQPLIAPEILITYALEKYYGIARATRYVRLTGTTDAEFQVIQPSPSEAEPSHPSGPTAAVRLEGRGEFLQQERKDLAQEPYRMDRAAKDLSTIIHPKDAFEVLKKFVAPDFARAVIFVVRGDRISGWEQVGCSISEKDLRNISQGQNDAGFLQLASRNRAAFVAPLAPGSTDQWLASLLGIKPGGDVFAGPISVNNQPVSVLAAAHPKRGELSEHLAPYDMLAAKISFALQMVYLRRRILGQ